MLDNSTAALAKQLEFTVEKNSAYGIYFKYLITLFTDSGNSAFYINFLVDENDDAESVCSKIDDKIKEVTSEFSVLKHSCDEGGLTVTAGCGTSDLLKLIDCCVELLSELNVLGCDHCSYCGDEFSASSRKKVKKGILNYIACESCALNIIEEEAKKNNDLPTPSKRDKIKGTCCAALGGLLGAVLYFITYALILPFFDNNKDIDVSFVACICGFITSGLVYLGYILFVKKDSLGAKITVSAISLLFTAIGQYVGILCVIWRDLSLTSFIGRIMLMPFRSTAVGATAANYATMFYTRLGISLVFAVCGAFIFLIGLYERSHVAKEEIKIDTVIMD